MNNFEQKLKAFAERLQKEQTEHLINKGYNPEICDVSVKVKPGKKYTKVDVGDSGKYMVVNDTGEIFGIKAYGVIHRGHQYGTLETVEDWDWGDYTATLKTTERGE